MLWLARLNASSNRPNRGVTLVELLVVLTIVGILAAIAAPSFRAILVNNQIQAASTEFQAALALARSEAIKRGADARVTVVANQFSSGTSADWSKGFTVFVDTSGNAHGKAPPSPGDTSILMVTSALSSSLETAKNIDSVTFNGLGRPLSSTGGMGNGSIAVGNSDMGWTCTIIGPSGRVRTAKLAASSYTDISSCPSS